MPELPEVQSVVNTLRPLILGARIISVRLNRRDVIHPTEVDLPSLLSGRRIESVSRRGKKIILGASACGQQFLCVHLGMTGRLTVEEPSAAVLPHTHVLIDIVDNSGRTRQFRFCDPRRFGGLWWVHGSAAEGGLGPEPLTTSATELGRRLARTRRAIKSALLDQRLLAGLGNIYVDEALFAARIHPQTPADQLHRAQVALLSRAMKRILRRAIDAGGSTFRDYVDATGRPGSYQKLHRVYGKQGQPCPRCASAIRRIVLGGRSTHFCPACQRR